jgi:hypothetical protein
MVDTVIDLIAAAQGGRYLNTYFMYDKAPDRWTNLNMHELYCRPSVLSDGGRPLSRHQFGQAADCHRGVCRLHRPFLAGRGRKTSRRLRAPETEMALVELSSDGRLGLRPCTAHGGYARTETGVWSGRAYHQDNIAFVTSGGDGTPRSDVVYLAARPTFTSIESGEAA